VLPVLMLSGHKGKLRSIAFSHDGRLLASCAGNGRAVSIWDTTRGKRLGFLTGHALRVTCLAFSPVSENRLASSAGSDFVYLWDVDSMKPAASLTNSRGTASSLAFSPDGRILTVGLYTWSTYFLASWDVRRASWDDRGPLSGSSANAFSLAFVNGRRTLVVGSDRSIDWWDYEARTIHRRVPQSSPVRALSGSSDGRTLASASRDRVTLWDTATQQTRLVLKGHQRLVNSLSFSPDNRTLASASSDGTVRFWDAETGQQREAFDWKIGRVWTVAFASDGMRAAAGGDWGNLILWDVDN
jgi:WD40 repeat protein